MPDTPIPVALIGSFRAVHRGAHFAQSLLERPSHFSVALCDPYWYPGTPPFLRKVLYGAWALRAVLGSRLVVFNAMQHAAVHYRVLRWLARTLGKAVVVDFYVSSYDTAVIDRKVVVPGTRQAEAHRAADRGAMMNADLAIFLSEAEKRYYCELVAVDPAQFSSAIVPLVSPPRPSGTLPWASGRSQAPCIAWWGYLGNPLHGIETIVEALGLLTKSGQDFRMLFFPAGSPRQLEELREQVAAQGLADRCEIDTEPSMQNGQLVARLASEVDVALGVFGGTRKARTVPVNKVVEAMSLGIPCLTGTSEALQEQLEDEALPMVEHEDPEALAQALLSLLSDRDRLGAAGRQAKSEWQRVYSPTAFDKGLMRALEAIVPKGR